MDTGKTEGNIKGPIVKPKGHVDAMLEGANIVVKLQIEEEFTKYIIEASPSFWCLIGVAVTYEWRVLN